MAAGNDISAPAGAACPPYEQGHFTSDGVAVEVTEYDTDTREHATAGRKFDGMVVISQTCDIARPAAQRPFVQLAPLVTIEDEQEAARAAAGHRPQFAPVPGAGDRAFADLDRIATWDRGAVDGWSWSPGLRDEDEKRWFADAVARKFARYAFLDEFHQSVSWLVDRVKQRHGKPNSPEGVALGKVETIRVRADWEEDEIEATLMFVLTPDALPELNDEYVEPTEELAEWAERKSSDPAAIADRLDKTADDAERTFLWTALTEAWAKKCTPRAPITAVIGEAHRSTEVTLDDLWRTQELDLDYLSGPDDQAS